MKVKISNAIKIFYPNPSFEMIYFEAIANALDAGATEMKIDITVPDMKQLQNLEIVICDNGVGFTEERFNKFEKLLDVEEQSHKGLGRLVYLVYFANVKIDSFFDDTQSRSFLFNESFEGENVGGTRQAAIGDFPQGSGACRSRGDYRVLHLLERTGGE